MNKRDLLNSLIMHAYNTVPYYRGLLNEQPTEADYVVDFLRVPLLRKDDVIKNENSLISSKYMGRYQCGDLLLKRTSGSTGKCMNVYWLPSDYYATNLEVWKYRSKWYGVSIKDRYAKFHSTTYVNGSVVQSPESIVIKGQAISFNKMKLSEENVHLYLTELKRFNPTWMTIQPSVLHTLLSCATNNEIDTLNNVKYIEFISEFLHKNTLDFFKNTLPNVKFGDLYGTTETGCVSLKCPCGNHHILDNVFVETFNSNYMHSTNDEGKIVLTSIRNSAMPFIRYCIGDYGKLYHAKCKCGFDGCSLSLTMGREFDVIELPDGKKRHSSIFWQIIEEVLDEYPKSIIQFYVTQEATNLMTFHLTLADEYRSWHVTIEGSLKSAFVKYFSAHIDCKIAYDCNDLARTLNKCNIYTRIN